MIDFLSISITNGILIFILITVLIFFCLYLYSDNKKLKKQMDELISENKILLEKKIKTQESVDTIAIKNISDEKIKEEYNEKLNIPKKENEIKETSPNLTIDKKNNTNMKEENINNDKEIKNTNTPNPKDNTYKEEVYHQEIPYHNTDPKIQSLNEFESYNTKEKINNYLDSFNTLSTPKTNSFDLSELINNNTTPTNITNHQEIKEYNYLEEISNRLNEELKPQTIELTDYEKRQEEQAVISYKELLKYKDNNNVYDEKQETINFIEELKNLRNSLK